jgi:hypothetical protein
VEGSSSPGEMWEAKPLRRGPQPQFLVLNPSNRLKTGQTNLNSNFKPVLTLTNPKKDLPGFGKFEIKYGFEGFEERNNFLHRNIFKFKVNFEVKNREALGLEFD